MTDRSPFEARLERALRDYAEQAVLPFDPDAIADDAISSPVAASPWTRRAVVGLAGIAAVLLVVVVAGQFIAGPLGIGTPRVIEADDLPEIVANATNTPGTWSGEADTSGTASLFTPMRSTRQPPTDGFVESHTTDMCGEDSASNPLGCVLSWAALYDTEEAARAAYAFYVDEFARSDGWNIPDSSRAAVAGLGDEAVGFTDVQDPAENGPAINAMYLWRSGTLLMAAVGVAELEDASLRAIADEIQARATSE